MIHLEPITYFNQSLLHDHEDLPISRRAHVPQQIATLGGHVDQEGSGLWPVGSHGRFRCDYGQRTVQCRGSPSRVIAGRLLPARRALSTFGRKIAAVRSPCFLPQRSLTTTSSPPGDSLKSSGVPGSAGWRSDVPIRRRRDRVDAQWIRMPNLASSNQDGTGRRSIDSQFG